EGLAGASGAERWFLELDQPAVTGLGAVLPEGVAPALADAAIEGGGFASIAVPLKLDPLATKGDNAFFAKLAHLTTVSAVAPAQPPRRYGQAPRPPAARIGLADDDVALVPRQAPVLT